MAARGDELIKSRLEKLETLRQSGVNPYPSKTKRKQTILNAREKKIGDLAEVAGRIIAWRGHGGSTFADLQDASGHIQLWFRKDTLGDEAYAIIKNFDVGDFLSVAGKIVQTQAGEITIEVTNFTLLTKSIRPIPSEYYGLKDIETRLRKRYLDLLVNPEIKEIFLKKARFWQAVRTFLGEHGFVEVESPVLELIPGGADARPFITHHNALDIDEYLRISLELYQKRLLVGGFEKTFEIGRIFRNEGIDAEHLQDYTQMEFYWAYANYEDLMRLTEEMFREVVQKTFGTLTITSHGHTVDWGKPWTKIDYFEIFKEKAGIDLSNTSVDALEAKAKELGLKHGQNISKGRLIDLIYKKTVRPGIIGPTHLINHPVDVSPLAKRHPDNPQKTERVQTMVYGTELSNGYSELNDPIDQRNRLEEQAKLRAAGDEEAQMMDEDFVEALEYGMPPAAGFGMSERVFSYLVDLPIREAVLFPALRPLGATERQAMMKPEKSSVPSAIGRTEESAVVQFNQTMTSDLPQSLRGTKQSLSIKVPSKVEVSRLRGNDIVGKDDRISVKGASMTKADAQTLVDELLQNQNLKNHCYAAGAAMGALYDQFEVEAERQGTTREDWEITGMLHDVDYEVTNKELEKHTKVTTEKLKEYVGFHPESEDQVEKIIAAVRGHCDKVARDTLMAKAIYACDELTGLIVAATLVLPDKKLASLSVDSVLKRFKEPSFAKGANRDQIATCDPELGLPLDVFTEIVLDAMKNIHDQLGL